MELEGNLHTEGFDLIFILTFPKWNTSQIAPYKDLGTLLLDSVIIKTEEPLREGGENYL